MALVKTENLFSLNGAIESKGDQMSVAILSNEDNAVFYCTTTDWAFGPLMPGANVAEAFLKYLTKDARLYQDNELESLWNQFCQTRMSAPCGHYMKADVEAYGDETIFTCMEEGCKVQWNLAGEEINEEEDDDSTEAERQMNRAEWMSAG